MPELFTVVTPDEALQKLRAHVSHRVESEEVKANLAYGRVTAADILVPSALPRPSLAPQWTATPS